MTTRGKPILEKWMNLKQSVQLAVHEQKDPLLIYKFEAFELFKVMLDQVNKDVISFLFKGELPAPNPQIRLVKQDRPRRQEKCGNHQRRDPEYG